MSHPLVSRSRTSLCLLVRSYFNDKQIYFPHYRQYCKKYSRANSFGHLWEKVELPLQGKETSVFSFGKILSSCFSMGLCC